EVTVAGELALEPAGGILAHLAGPLVVGAVDHRSSVQLVRWSAELHRVREWRSLVGAGELAAPLVVAKVRDDARHGAVQLAVGRAPRSFVHQFPGAGGRGRH